MSKILELIDRNTGGRCLPTYRTNIDHERFDDHDDKEEVFNESKVGETSRYIKNRHIDTDLEHTIFTYFLDGSRRTFRVSMYLTSNGKYLPLVAAQIGSAICKRENGTMKKFKFLRKNILLVPNLIPKDEIDAIQESIIKDSSLEKYINEVVSYSPYKDLNISPENIAIAKANKHMHDQEIELIHEMVNSNYLETDDMMIIDGSLQFSGIQEKDEKIFENVVGISKNFNPRLTGVLKSSKKEIGSYLTELEVAQRTPVVMFPALGNKMKLKIGAWYIRIHPKDRCQMPLEGIIKVENLDKEQELAEDTKYQEKIQKSKPKSLPLSPQPKPPPVTKGESNKWKKDAGVARGVIEEKEYSCEYNDSHKTFIAKTTNNNYVEAHHLVPMKEQYLFEYSLDVTGNIISLCPNCHRLFHHAKTEEKNKVIEFFFFKQDKITWGIWNKHYN